MNGQVQRGRRLGVPRAALVGLAVLLAGCGAPGGGSGGGATSGASSASETPLDVHRVRAGDTLFKIAKGKCGDRGAVVSIYDANRGRLQRDGKALVDPDRIVPGWDLIIDCSAAGSLNTFTAAADQPQDVPPDAGDLREQPVPENTVALRPPSQPVVTGEGKCLGTSTQPLVRPWVLQAGADAQAVELRQGSGLFFVTEGFSDTSTADLVDAAGRRRPIERASIGFDLYIDPALRPGQYVIEATYGNQTATGTLRVTRAQELQLVRRDFSRPQYDIVGGGDSLALTIYRWAPGSCDDDAAPWQDSGPLQLADGVGRLTVTTEGALPGRYCLAVTGVGTPTQQCRDNRLFSVG